MTTIPSQAEGFKQVQEACFVPTQATTYGSVPDEKVNAEPTVIRLYGISGSGKTFLINNLKQELGHEDFKFYEGSKTITALVPRGLESFQSLDKHAKASWRERAIDEI